MSSTVLYVSWGGSGRAATFRKALEAAREHGCELVYLAVLDPHAFGDLDDTMSSIVVDELDWLLSAQIELVRRQTGIDDTPVRVIVRSGTVADVVAEICGVVAVGTIVVGAPVPVSGKATVEELLDEIGRRTGRSVEVITAD